MIMALPIRVLRLLTITPQQKVGLIGVFSVGFIIIAMSFLRLSQIIGKERSDPVGLAVWGVVESSVSVFVGSLPPLKGFLQKAVERSRQRSSRSSPYGSGVRAKKFSGHRNSRQSFSKARARMDSIPLDDDLTSLTRTAEPSSKASDEPFYGRTESGVLGES
jgi:hypothetical protein